jgi:hypothetical protein
MQTAIEGSNRPFSGGSRGAAQEHRRPLLAYHSEHYQALREVHGPLLKSIETITGKRAPFIQWNGTGPAKDHPG